MFIMVVCCLIVCVFAFGLVVYLVGALLIAC